MSICTDSFKPAVLRPKRARKAECSQFKNLDRWINFVMCLNLTPDPSDNDPTTGPPAWTCWDLPVTVAWQDVDDRGDDRLLVAIGTRVYVLDWERFQDEWNWEAFYPIYRRITMGPIPGSRNEQEDGPYMLAPLKRFRRFTYQLAEAPTDAGTQYRISVLDDGEDTSRAATGLRTTVREGTAQVAHRGYSFLVTLEHEANEDFPLLWWQAEYEELGDRRPNDPPAPT